MKVVSIIRARGISGELQRKNLHPILGRPMIAYTLDALRQSGVVDKIYVFTEDETIAELTQAAGGMVIPRTKDQLFYNGGFSAPADWTKQIFEFVERDAGPFASLVTININCNFCLLTPETIGKMFYTLMEHETATEIVAVSRVEPHLFTVNPATGLLFPIWHDPGLDRQNYPPLFRHVGGIEICHRLRASRSHVAKRIYHEMSPWESLDVQTAEDVDMAEYFVAKRRAAAQALAETQAAAAGVVALPGEWDAPATERRAS